MEITMSKIFYQILVDVLPKLWGTIKIENVSVDYSVEIIHVLSSDYLSVCLVNTNKGTPFISALELRPLDNNTYITQTGSLELSIRLDVGSTSNATFRLDLFT